MFGPNGEKRQGIGIISQSLANLGWVMGLEPTTPGTTIRCSNQLSYTHQIYGTPRSEKKNGTPEGTRTPGLLLRRQLLYPAELLAHIGAGDENRTRIPSLEGWCPDHCATPAFFADGDSSPQQSSASSYYHSSFQLSIVFLKNFSKKFFLPNKQFCVILNAYYAAVSKWS